MKKPQAALLLLAASGLAVGSVTASALPASANLCAVEVTQLRALNLQDNGNQDEIKFRMGGDMHGVFTFTELQTRNASLGSPREVFNGSVPFTLHEQDGLVRQTITSRVINCNPGTHTVPLQGNGAIYNLTYRVTT